MPDQGITVTPSLVTNPDGSQSVSYDEAQVVSTDGRQRAIANFNAEQENYIHEDSMGRRSHAFDYGAQQDELLYQPEVPTTEGIPLPEQDIQYVFDQVGGTEQWNEMMSWSKANLPPDIINTFNQVMNGSDMEEILNVTKALSDFYHQNQGESFNEEPPQRRAPVEEFFPTDEQVDEVERFSQLMFDKIGGEENYHTLMGWAQNNLTSTSIDIFDQIMEGDDYQAKAQAIDMLIKSFRDQGDD